MSGKKTSETSDFFNYKGYPLVRNGDTIYYGNMSDEYVVITSYSIHYTKLYELELFLKVM